MKAINARIHQKHLNILIDQAGIVPEDLRLVLMRQQVDNKLYTAWSVPLIMVLPVRTAGSITIFSLQFVDLSNAFLIHKLNELRISKLPALFFLLFCR